MKQQLLVINRSRRRGPHLLVLDRFLLGFWSLFLTPRHIQKAAIIIRPSVLLRFHEALKKRKYRLLRSHWVLVVMDQFTRRIIGFGVHASDIDGVALCRLFIRAISGKGQPRYLSSDHGPLFEYYRWKANLRILDVEEMKTLPYAPLPYPFVERLIGSIRRELLDHTLFWNAADLETKLAEFQSCFNEYRVHSALGGHTPAEVSGERVNRQALLHRFGWQTHCRGLYQLPVAA